MERCPRCHLVSPRYKYRTRPRYTYLVVVCENCGFSGKEVPIMGPGERHESAAAYAAADAWNKDSRRQTVAKRLLH